MIEIKHLIKRYSDFSLEIENLNIEAGERVAIVGNNGAGKTTLLKAILNFLSLEEGWIKINGEKVNFGENWKVFTNSYLDPTFIIDFLTPKEFITFTLDAYNKKRYCKDLLDFFDFESDSTKLIRDLSQGNLQKIGIISALVSDPKMLILDEPYAHLDPTSRTKLSQLFDNLHGKRNDQLRIISSHDINEIMEVSDRVILLDDGKIKFDNLISENVTLKIREHFLSKL